MDFEIVVTSERISRDCIRSNQFDVPIWDVHSSVADVHRTKVKENNRLLSYQA